MPSWTLVLSLRIAPHQCPCACVCARPMPVCMRWYNVYCCLSFLESAPPSLNMSLYMLQTVPLYLDHHLTAAHLN